jgi:ceramide glucosyltransferase
MTVALVILALVLLAVHLTTVGLYLWRMARPAPQQGSIGLPPVTLLRPVCGRDPFDEETLGSSFAQDYPDYRIIFCAPHEGDPAVPLVRRLIAAHPEVPARLIVGERRMTGNPKLNNLWQGWDAAETDHVCMTDSNLMLPPGYLRAIVASWRPGTGLVSSPALGVVPDGIAGSIEAAFLNSNQARWQFAADTLGIGFAQGKSLFWSKPWLDAQGGLAVLGRYLAEDVNATKIVRAAGLKVRLTHLPFGQPIGRKSLAAVWGRQLRWSRVRRDGFPGVFYAEPLNGALLPHAALALALGLAGGPWAALPAFALVWYGAELWLMRQATWPQGWRDILALPLRDLMMPALWLATFRSRNIEWRGTAMAAPVRGSDRES